MLAIARTPRRVVSSLLTAGVVVAALLVFAVPSGAHVHSRATLQDGDVVLGSDPVSNCTVGALPNCENQQTGIVNPNPQGTALAVTAIATGGIAIQAFGSEGGVAASGDTGVLGLSNSNPGVGVDGTGANDATGVSGSADSGQGVVGFSNSNNGVYGRSLGADAIVGDLPSNSTGVNGVTG
jgi:hypothetical protein